MLKELEFFSRDVQAVVADLHEVELKVVYVGEGDTANLSKETVRVVVVIVHLGCEHNRAKCEPIKA